jgi:hypothetical protein
MLCPTTQESLQMPQPPAAEKVAPALDTNIYGYPLVYNLDELVKFPDGTSTILAGQTVPYNEFGLARDLLTPQAKFVSPINDTLYIVVAADVGQGPLVVSVPDTGDRYYGLQFIDAWTNNFAYALRRRMDLFGDWIATKNGMFDTLLATIDSGKIAHAQTRTELLAAITEMLDAGCASGDLRSDVTIGIFTEAPPPDHEAKAARLLNILMDGLRPSSFGQPELARVTVKRAASRFRGVGQTCREGRATRCAPPHGPSPNRGRSAVRLRLGSARCSSV